MNPGRPTKFVGAVAWFGLTEMHGCVDSSSLRKCSKRWPRNGINILIRACSNGWRSSCSRARAKPTSESGSWRGCRGGRSSVCLMCLPRTASMACGSFTGTASALTPHQESLEAEFDVRPPHTVSEACQRIEELTGVRRKPTRVRKFLRETLKLSWRKVAAVPVPPKLTVEEHAKKQAAFLKSGA